MLVDDEPDIVQVMKSGLELRGFQIDAFTDPTKALEHFKPDIYDIVVTDIRMPSMDGFELHDKIREIDPGIKIYLLSAFDSYQNQTKEMYGDKRLTEFIRKPISYSALAQKLLREMENR